MRINCPLLQVKVTSLVSLLFISLTPNQTENSYFPSTRLFNICSNITTGDSTHTTLQERMVPATDLLFSSECMPNY